MELKKTLLAVATSAALGALGMVVAAQPATARMVCNSDGDCWHTDDSHARYSNDVHAQYHPDDWYFHQHWDSDREHHYRDYHDGPGYYRHGAWVSE